MVTHICECKKNWIAHLKLGDFIVHELYLNKAVFFKFLICWK